MLFITTGLLVYVIVGKIEPQAKLIFYVITGANIVMAGFIATIKACVECYGCISVVFFVLYTYLTVISITDKCS